MSSTTDSSITFIGQQITIYGGMIILGLGVLGNLINIIVFLSLKIIRQSSCAFYLTIMSFVNIGQLLSGLLTHMMSVGFQIDWTVMSLSFCKFRWTFFQLCTLMSYTCLCLATIDQYCATCTRLRFQQWSSIKIAHRLMTISIIICILLLIPYPILTNYVLSPVSDSIACATTNMIMARYANFFVALSLSSFVPDFITVVFGSIAYRNVQQIAYRTVPLVRRELDKQLTIMVLVQVIINLFTNVPFVTMNAVIYATVSITNSMITDIIQFIYSMLLIIFYTYFAVSRNVYD
jgi:hypothetical protein